MENMCCTAVLMTGPVPFFPLPFKFRNFVFFQGTLERGGVWEKSQNNSIPTRNLHFQYYENNNQLKKYLEL